MYRRLVILSAFIAMPILATNLPVPSLTARGRAIISRPADQLQISIGVTTNGIDAKSTLDENNEKMNKLINALIKAGLGQKEYETGRFSIHPLYSSRPKNAPHDWVPKIAGFEVVNSLNIQTDKIDLAGNLIDAAANAGANSIESVRFGISKTQNYRQELINTATLNALSDARSLSESASVKLKRIISLTIDDAGASPAQPYLMKAMAGENTPIAAGDIEMKAGVTVVYEIE